MDIVAIEHVAQQFLRDVQVTRFAEVAASMIVVWDHLVTIDQEIELIWKARWSIGKALFLFNRYYTLLAIAFNNYIFFVDSGLTDEICKIFFRWQAATFVLAITVSQVTLQLRLYALYHTNKLVLAFMITTFALCMICAIVIIIIMLQIQSATANPFPGVHFCASTHASKLFWTFWIPFLVSESLLCALAIFRAFSYETTSDLPPVQYNRRGKLWKRRIANRRRIDGVFDRTNSIIAVLIRDSILYFLVMFVAYLTNCLMWAVGPVGLREAPVGFAEALTCVMCSHVLLNVRDVHQQRDQPQSQTSQHALRELSVVPPASPSEPTKESPLTPGSELFDETYSTTALRHGGDLEEKRGAHTRVEFKTELTSEELYRLRRLRTR